MEVLIISNRLFSRKLSFPAVLESIKLLIILTILGFKCLV